jgi:hypothetical protein
MTTFYCLKFEIPPNLEGQVPIFISPRDRVVQLYPQALGSLSVASYEVFDPASIQTELLPHVIQL